VLFLTVSLFGTVLWLWSGCSAGKTPPPELYRDFGVIRHGLAKDHVFEVPMPETVDDEEVIPVTFWGDCACASATILIQGSAGHRRLVSSLARPDARVRPGEKVLLSLTLDTSTLEPVSVTRKLSHGWVTFESLRSTNPRRYRVLVTFHWGIHAPVKLTPVAKVDFDQLAYAEHFSQRIELRGDQPGHELRLGDIHIDDPRVTARLISGEAPGPYLLEVTFRPDRKQLPGPFRTLVTIQTNIPNDPGHDDFYKIPIAVVGTVTEDILVIPPRRRGADLSFGKFDFRQRKELFVTVVDHDRSRPTGFVLDGIRSNNGVDLSKHFQVRFEPDNLDDRRTRIWVTYLGTFEGTWLLGELSLAKNDGGPSLFRLTFRGLNSKP